MSNIELQIQKIKELIYEMPEVKEYLNLKEAYTNSSELNELRIKIANEKNNEIKNIMIREFNENPLVQNFLSSKEQVESILKIIKNILSD